MPFERLQGLGEEKFQKIVNGLVRGTPALTVARLIRQEWGDFHDVAEDTLAKQLKRLNTAISQGAFGTALAEQAKQKPSVQIKLLKGSSLNVLDELVELAVIQKARVLAFRDREEEWQFPMFTRNPLVNDYRDLLLAIHKIKLDLGIDEYKRTILATPVDSWSNQRDQNRTILEATAVLQEIFRKRGIGLPKPSDLNEE